MNKIVNIQGIDKCISLKNLELSFNQIVSINALPPSLQTLDLSGNLLTSCSFLANKEKLEFLNLNHNKFINLKSMPQLPSLDYLDVSENQLTLLGVWLQDYPNLRSLNISSNQLDSMFEVYCLIPTENFEVLFCLNNPFNKNFSQEEFNKHIIGSFEGLRQLNGENIIRETPKMRRLKQMVQKLEESEVSDLDELIESHQIKEGTINPKQPLIKEIDMVQIELEFNQIKNKFQSTNLSIHETYQRKVKLLEELGLVENVEAFLKQLEEQDQEMKNLESLEQENEVKEEEYLYPRPPQFPKSANRPLTPIQETFEDQNQEKSRPSSSRGSQKRKIFKDIKEQAKEIQREQNSQNQGRSTPQKPISKTRERIVSALAFKLDQALKK